MKYETVRIRLPPFCAEAVSAGIGRDLQIGAVVIGISTRIVLPVLGHPLNNLQRALRAVDVRQLDVGFEGLRLAGRV